MEDVKTKTQNETEPAMKIRGYQNFVWPYLFIIAAHPGSAEYHSVDVTYQNASVLYQIIFQQWFFSPSKRVSH